jgi:hypothetical protein
MMGVVKMISMKHIIPLALMLLSVTGCATASDTQMTAAQIKTRIIGNTIVGDDEGKPYREYYSADGTIAGTDTEAYTGAWRFDGNKLCTGFESDDDKTPGTQWTCSDVSVVGDRVIWNNDGDVSEAKLLAGKQ